MNKKVFLFLVLNLFVGLVFAAPKTKAVKYDTPKADPDIIVEIYNPDKAYNGTTLFPDLHKSPRIIEINMKGEIIWEYALPPNLREYTNPGLDAEVMDNGNILILYPRYGAVEIDRDGNTVWEYRDSTVSHNADRLANGNTLIVCGFNDTKAQAQVKEISPDKKIVWQWRAKDHYNKPPYSAIDREGWTHTNCAVRLDNGNTLISLRNFDLVIEVDKNGNIVKESDVKEFGSHPHGPKILANGHLLFTVHVKGWDPILEINRETNEKLWAFHQIGADLMRDVFRFPNGNSFMVTSNYLIEVAPDKEVVWKLKVAGIRQDDSRPMTPADRPDKCLFKARRLPSK